jgi:DNA-binding SARP family transcriptional activator
MATLRVYALGQLRVFCDQEPLQFPTQKAQDLLCLLLLHAGETMERERIAERFWPMRAPGKACRCLSTALWRLRQSLGHRFPSDPPYLLVTSDTLTFNTNAPHWFDVAEFEQHAAFGLAGPLPCSEAQCQELEAVKSSMHIQHAQAGIQRKNPD